MRINNNKLLILFIIVNVFYDINCKESDLKDCIIDNKGKFKYIQIKANNIKNPNESKIIIRGTSENVKYHKDIFTNFINNEINNNIEIKNNFSFDIIGGGKIIFENNNKIILYGFSTAYGPADHSLTSSIIKKYYPNYKIEIKYD